MLTLFIFNTAFLLIRIARTFLPKQPIAQEVIRGLSAGAFSISEYPQKQEQNPMIGLYQWTDCLSFEVVLVGSSTIMTEALAPRVLIPPTSNERCSAVVGFVSGTFRPSEFYTYTRFWHGYSTVMSAMLQVMPLGGYFYGGVAFAGFYAAMTGRETLLVLLPLLVVGFAASEIDQLGALVSHSPAFIGLWAMAGLLLLLQNRLDFLGLLLFALSFGAVEAFLDLMIFAHSALPWRLFSSMCPALIILDERPCRKLSCSTSPWFSPGVSGSLAHPCASSARPLQSWGSTRSLRHSSRS